MPESEIVAWRAAFDAPSGVDVEGGCPVCGEAALHRWFDLRDKHPEAVSRGWAGRGGQWQWCSACRAYEHSNGYVPTWWADRGFEEARLRHDPEPLEIARLAGNLAT